MIGERTRHSPVRGAWRIPRSKGAIAGALLMLFGAWGAIIPFAGPYFGYAYTPGTTWVYTWGRLYLDILPGAAAVLGGFFLLFAANRLLATIGGWLAAAAGAWFIIGPTVSRFWAGLAGGAGAPIGGAVLRAEEQLGFFYGTGIVILALAMAAAGRLAVRGVRDVRAAERHAVSRPRQAGSPYAGTGATRAPGRSRG